MGIPGILVALIVWTTLRDPPRGYADGHIISSAAPSLISTVRYLAGKRTYFHLLVGYVIAGVTLNAIGNFVLPFYLRSFDVPLALLGAVFGFVAFTSIATGMLLGGFGFDWLSRKDGRWLLWGPAIAMTVCVPIYFGAFVSREIVASLAFVWFGNMLLITLMAPTMATIQNLVGPQMRATTTAMTALVVGLVALPPAATTALPRSGRQCSVTATKPEAATGPRWMTKWRSAGRP